MKNARRDVAAGAAVVFFLACGGVWIEQLGVYSAESRRLEVSLRDMQDDIAKARAAERKLSQFRDEIDRLEHEIASLRSILPESLDADAYASRLAAHAARFGVELCENQFRQDTSVTPQRGEMSVLLFGSDEAIGRFVAAVPKLTPISSWKEDERSKEGALGVLTTYAFPDPDPIDVPARSVSAARGPWLWPYSAKFRTLEARAAGLAREAARHEGTMKEIRRYERDKAALEEVLATAQSLTKDSPEPEPRPAPVRPGR